MSNLLNYIFDKYPFDNIRNLIVSVSGGPDSIALLDMISKKIDKKRHTIICVHFNHKKRLESEEEYKYIQKLCTEKGYVFKGFEFEYTEEELKHNFQQTARKKRYEYLLNVAAEYKSNMIFLAHHGDDQIETILYKIIRGSNLKGYSGMQQISKYRDCYLIRPLLDKTKEELLQYCAQNDLFYFIDKSNISDTYLRNRIRANMIPFLKSENKDIHKKFNQFSNILFESHRILEELSNHFIDNFVKINNEKVSFHNTEFAKQFKAVQKHIIMKLIFEYFSNANYDKLKIEDIISFIGKENGSSSFSLSQDINIIREYNEISIVHSNEKKDTSVYLEINDYGTYKLQNGCNVLVSKNWQKPHKPYKVLCYNNIEFPIIFRNKKPGDKIKINDNNMKKLSRILIDEKIPLKDRDNIIVLVNKNDEIIWVPQIKRAAELEHDRNENYIYYEYGGSDFDEK